MSKRSYAVLALVALLHGALGAAVGLSVDEAHYLLYALHPALSYFDHPPLVGWVQWPLVALNAPTVVLRLVPGLLWLASALLVYRITLRLSGTERAAFWALLVFALAPLLHVLGIGLLPDTLLVFFALALMRQTLVLCDAAAVQRLGPWLLLGLLLGLAGLSKYTAVLPAAAVALCLIKAHGLRLLRNHRLWVAVVIALVLVLPVLVWNAQNGWISFTYQAKHGAGSAWEWVHVLRFLVLQLLAFGPLLIWGLVSGRANAQDAAAAPWGLRAFFVIPFVVLAFMAGGGSSLPHWTAPAWATLAPFAGMALARVMHGVKRLWVVVLLPVLMVFQALCCAALLGLMASAGQPLIVSSAAEVAPAPNPFADLHGWDEAGLMARQLAERHQLKSVAAQNWTLASRLGWYARPLPVYVLQDRFDQFDLWAGDLPQGGRTLLVDWSHLPYELPLGSQGFAQCDMLGALPIERWGWPIASFRFYECSGWSANPAPQLKLPPTPPNRTSPSNTTPSH